MAFLAAFAVLVVIAWLSYRALDQREAAAEALHRTHAVQMRLETLGSALKDAETGQRGFLLTGDRSYLEPYELAKVSLPGMLAELRVLTSEEPAQVQRIDDVTPLINAKIEELGRTITFARDGDHDAALAVVRSSLGKQLMDQVRSLLEAIDADSDRLLAQRAARWEDSVRWSSTMTFGGSAVLLAMLVLIGYFASRDYRALRSEGWLRRVHVGVANDLQGDLHLGAVGDRLLAALSRYLDPQVGVVFATEAGGRLRRIADHALEAGASGQELRIGEGLTGQAVKMRRAVQLADVPPDYLRITSATGRSRARTVAISPAIADGMVQAVIELGFLRELDALDLEALDRISETVGMAVRSARIRMHLEELLGETQRQAEELQSQQEELKVANEELEQQTRALQLSQHQLSNQQAELEQINAQLEEQTQSLEHQRDELARAGAELQRSNEYKSQFLANMSHELRTPLNSSLILAKLLADNRDGNLNAEQIRFARTIYSAGNDLLTLINDILDLSKIEAGMLDIRPEPVPLSRLLDELRTTFQPVADHRHLELDTRIAPGTPESISTDPMRLQQIVKNLVSKALKFTERGGVAIEVSAAARGLQISVQDTGIGIAAEQHQLIFEPFRQADGASTRRFGGTGLGLSISRDLARMLGGELEVESAPGRGSTFTLTLPLAYSGVEAPVSRPSGRARGTEPPPVAAPEAIAPAPFPDDREQLAPGARALLVIEDDVEFARVLYQLAHDLDFRAIVATTAETGIALARQHAPSAIVLDVGLPDRSGLAVLDTLKRDPRTRHVPVHMVSVSDHKQAAFEMGAAGYALKPIQREELIEAIKRLESKFTQKIRRVLIVEDDPRLRESTQALLAGGNVETVAAGTAAAALDHLRASTFDCMVLDLTLPDRSGLELLEEMASSGSYGFPPVIVYTGRSLTPDQLRALERFSRSIIIKGARSPERLLDEVTLFLHQVEAELPPERQRMLRDVRDREAVFEGKRILIVEDDVRNVFALSSVLEPRGATVEIARNGREALDQLEHHPNVDLVLMDVMMPEMDGLEATRRLRTDPRFAKLPVIAITAKAMIDDRIRCLDAGANDYISKPLDVDKLLSLARVWIRK